MSCMIKTQRPYFFYQVNARPVAKFKGKRTYVSTGDSDDMAAGGQISYDNRPSRANVSPKINDVIFAKMANTKKTFLIDETLSNYVFSTGFFDISSTKFDPKYLYYLIMSDEFDSYKNTYSEGATQVSISDKRLKKIVVTYEDDILKQRQIVDFLDKKCATIDRLIEIKKKEIEEVKRYFQVRVNEVVTKGLDSNVLMKESGIKWIGLIPQNWSVKRLRFIAHSISKGNGITKDDVVTDGDTFCVRYGEIYTKYSKLFSICATKTNLKCVPSPVYFEYGDVLFTATGELIEEIGKSIVYLGHDKCLAGGDIILLKHREDPLFMGFALDSIYAQAQKSFGKSKLKVVHSSSVDIKNLLFALPPLNIQRQIGEYCFALRKHINRLIDEKNKKINELELYRKSLIYEYVSGKREILAK